MIYDLSNDFQRKAFLARSNNLLEKGAVIDVTEKVYKTPNQNRYLHLIIGVVALDSGVTIKYAKEEYFKRLVNEDIFCVRREDKYCGEVTRLRSIKELTREELSMAIDRFKRWGYEQGLCIPSPGDTELLKQIEIELGRNKAFLG